MLTFTKVFIRPITWWEQGPVNMLYKVPCVEVEAKKVTSAYKKIYHSVTLSNSYTMLIIYIAGIIHELLTNVLFNIKFRYEVHAKCHQCQFYI